MTNDYKETLLKYLTNNLDSETGTDIPAFSDTQYIEKDDYISELDEMFPYGYTQQGELKCKNSNNEYNGYSIVYGYYKPESGSSARKGFILLFDENMDMVATFTSFSSGTQFDYFSNLNIDEKGQVYGVDKDFANNGTNRFIMLNNISVKNTNDEYAVVLRQSYYIQGDEAYQMLPNFDILEKDENSARYLFMRTAFNALTLEIKVGESNVWTYYEKDDEFSATSTGRLAQVLPVWDSEGNLTLSYYFIGAEDNVDYIYRGYNEDTEIKCEIIGSIDDLFSDLTDFTVYTTGGFWSKYKSYSELTLAENEGYVMIGGTYNDSGDYKLIYRTFKIEDTTLTKVYEAISDVANNGNTDMRCRIYNMNNTIFVGYYWNIDTSISSPIYTYYGALILDDITKIVDITLANVYSSSNSKFHLFDIRNAYNLYSLYFLGEDADSGLIYLRSSSLIYNSNNYNGTAYEDINALYPIQGLLYNEDGEVIFARNLYNKVLTKNTTQATIEIPNTMLNDINIAQQDLYGATNYQLITNTDTINKNIYETLYINFFNTLVMQNRNTDAYITNLTGATRLNNSISNLLDYEDATITKYRINYSDNTSVIKNVNSCTITNDIATITFDFYVYKEIDSIDILSNDEETIYQTISNGFNVGSIYTLTQDCYIE